MNETEQPKDQSNNEILEGTPAHWRSLVDTQKNYIIKLDIKLDHMAQRIGVLSDYMDRLTLLAEQHLNSTGIRNDALSQTIADCLRVISGQQPATVSANTNTAQKVRLSDVRAELQKRFGVIEEELFCAGKPTVFRIKRNQPPYPERPYMTIDLDAGVNGSIGFSNGHYDLSREDAIRRMWALAGLYRRDTAVTQEKPICTAPKF